MKFIRSTAAFRWIQGAMLTLVGGPAALLPVLLVVPVLVVLPVRAAGIPEPSLVLYGGVYDAVTNARVTLGSLQWTFRPTGGGPPVVVTTQLTNVDGQFSYVVFIPAESPLPGQPLSPNTLSLTPAPIPYDRADVTVNGLAVTLLPPAAGNLTLGLTDRGRVERVDLRISTPLVDTDGNGLPDAWEQAYFGRIDVDLNADPDDDGLSNAEEWLAGTDPTNGQSHFKFIRIGAEPAGGARLEWSSVGGRTYSVLRSATVVGGFVPIRTGVPATPPINVLHDSTASGAGQYFYRLQVEE